MNFAEQEKRDTEFYKAFAKNKSLSRAKFNAEYNEKNKVKPTKKIDYFSVKSPTETHKEIYDGLREYCTKFPNVKTPNIVLTGATGTGKTFAANLIQNALKQKRVWVEYSTAFNMVNNFQKFVNTFGRETEKIDDYLECDLLIIDDLGAEPTIKNVTNEHIYNIINERLINKKPFVITTNLSEKALIERYDQRIASRILARETNVFIEFTGKDLRLK
jgi:DNA replication protein DnaC